MERTNRGCWAVLAVVVVLAALGIRWFVVGVRVSNARAEMNTLITDAVTEHEQDGAELLVSLARWHVLEPETYATLEYRATRVGQRSQLLGGPDETVDGIGNSVLEQVRYFCQAEMGLCPDPTWEKLVTTAPIAELFALDKAFYDLDDLERRVGWADSRKEVLALRVDIEASAVELDEALEAARKADEATQKRYIEWYSWNNERPTTPPATTTAEAGNP